MAAVPLPAVLLLLGFLAGPLRAEGTCLRLEGDPGRARWLPVEAGEEVRLRFRHSLWGSLVEERFRVAAAGLTLVGLRYAERRLVEFYGHEAARPEGNWWVVEDVRRWFPDLSLRVSRGSNMGLAVGREAIPLGDLAGPDGVIRLSVGGCGPPAKVKRRAGPPGKEGDPDAGRSD